MGSTVNLQNIHRSFGPKHILRGVSVELKNSEAAAILGPNGAGKTTLLRIISTLLKPTSGKVTLFGKDADEDTFSSRRRIGVLFAEGFLYNDLTVKENLIFFSKLYHLSDIDSNLKEWLQAFAMEKFQDELVRTLSRGERQKIALIRSVLHSPELILWDEPTTGFDLASKERFRAVASRIKETATIICTTHDLSAVEGWSDYVFQLENGVLQ